MTKVRNIFRWTRHPQALIGFVTLCLCVASLTSNFRSASAGSVPSPLLRAQSSIAKILPSPPDCNARPCIALTFDDGPSAEVTPQVLDILARQHVNATFFVVGIHVPGKEALLQREYRQGNEIGNHTWSHPDLSKLSPEDVENQLQMTQHVIADAGVPAPRLLRPPYGSVNQMVAAHNNLTVVRWNVDPNDWLLKDPAKIDQQVMAQVRPGAIIIMHDIYPTTAAALEPLIIALKQQYQFVTASQLLNLSPGDQGQYFSR